MAQEKVAVVTGGNKGIGYAIVKGLCKKFPGVVYLTSRDVTKGKAAVEELNKFSLKPEYHQLDITNKNSVIAFAEFIKAKHGGLNILVNNAAIAYKKNSTNPFSEQAEVSVNNNYFGLLNVCHALFPLLRPHARVVNVSSSAGNLARIPGKDLQKKFMDPNLTEEKLTSLMKEFVESTKRGDHEQQGWGRSAYAVSKVGVSALTFIQHWRFQTDLREDIVVNCVHPGSVSTDMSSHTGTMTIEEGADAPLYLALLPPNVKEPRGEYVWYDRSIVNWLEPPKVTWDRH